MWWDTFKFWDLVWFTSEVCRYCLNSKGFPAIKIGWFHDWLLYFHNGNPYSNTWKGTLDIKTGLRVWCYMIFQFTCVIIQRGFIHSNMINLRFSLLTQQGSPPPRIQLLIISLAQMQIYEPCISLVDWVIISFKHCIQVLLAEILWSGSYHTMSL